MTRPRLIDDDVATRVDGRRAQLRTALRSGDLSTAARAASRTRLLVLTLAPGEAAAAGEARRRLGRALRVARVRDSATPSHAAAVFEPHQPVRVHRVRRAVISGILVLATLFVLPARDTLAESPDAREAALTAFICTRVMDASDSTSKPETMTAPAPQYYGSAISDAMAARANVDAYRRRGLRSGFARLVGRVVDDTTGAPLDDACLEFVRGSTRLRARTDASGIFTIDLPVTRRPVDLVFGRAGYLPAQISFESWGAVPVSFVFDVRITSR
ncbi:MAG: carboxypeptidase-like regulatory domain-containing protein [Chloroflexi bacterium]|nr:MAG: carboxypeptidase-like regulatory domain-containing protein [Chloroflexota bacterium]